MPPSLVPLISILSLSHSSSTVEEYFIHFVDVILSGATNFTQLNSGV
jgi:hypothetical protein